MEEHSRLLKFFRKGSQNIPEMAEVPTIIIEKDYQSPTNVEAEVPGTHKIRELRDDKKNSSDINTSEIKITGAEFTWSPVMTVTKKESTLTKGDMKQQKITVTEDISVDELENGGLRISHKVESLTQTDRQPNAAAASEGRERRLSEKMDGEEKSQDKKKSKIPQLRQAAERVKKDIQAQKAKENPRRSSIPKLKDAKKAVQRDTSLKVEPKVEDEFDKIYEEIVENKPQDVDDKILASLIEDPEKIETKFEEIIHAYDEDEHEKHTVSKISKIPGLRRKDDEPSRIKAVSVTEKNTVDESKLKDGGFKVTASTIKTKRFSRGNSRNMSKEEQHIVTETIDIKESDNDVFVKETVKSAPIKPKRFTRNIKRLIADDHKADTVETTVHTGDSVIQNIVKTENVERKDGIPHESKKVTHVISKEFKERSQDLNKKLEDVRKKLINNGTEDSVTVQEFKDDGSHIITTETTVSENVEATPVKTERIVRDVSREIIKDGQNISNTETVIVGDLKDGGTRTVTKTTVTESMKVGTPVKTEKVIRNISRVVSTEGQNDSIKGVVITEETTSGGGKKTTKETFVRENAKGIPVKTERFTRGISREMGNIRQKSKDKETVTAENLNPDDKKDVTKKETIKTEQIEKEGVKAGIPTFTKVTRSFSKGRIHNVEMSRSIEWKPAHEIKTNNYSRSVSEKVTKGELKDTSNLKFEELNAEVRRRVSDKSNVETDSTSNQKTPKNPVLEGKIKDSVKDIAKTITTRRTIDYKSEEQVTNIEKNTFTLSKTVDLTVDKDLKISREIGTQMGLDGKVVDLTIERDFKPFKEIGTQMSIEGKAVDSIVDRDFTAAREIGTQMSVESKIYVSTVDRDNKVAREIGTQMSMEGTKDIRENDSNKFNKEYSTEIIKEAIITDNLKENSEKEHSNLLMQEKDSDTEEVTILKGNRLEPKEPYPVIEIPTSRIKCKYVPPTAYQINNEEKPRIVDEVLKEKTQFDSLGDTNNIEIGINYDEVTYRNEPVVVKEFWKTEEGYGPDAIAEKTALQTEEASLNQQQGTNDWETAQTLPKIIHFRTEESQIEFDRTLPVLKDVKTNVDQLEGSILLPEIININPQQSTTEEVFEIVGDKALIQRDHNQLKTTLLGKVDYEAEIGKTNPGKINLNKWNNQVETNKRIVDKIGAIKGENLHGIAKTLPGKVDFKTYKSQVPVSKDLPGKNDFKKDEFQIEVAQTLPAKIDFVSQKVPFEAANTFPGRINSKTDDNRSVVVDNLPGDHNFKTQDYQIDDFRPLPGKIDFKSDEILPTEIATTSPEKMDVEAKSHQIEITKPLHKPKTSQKEEGAGKPKPGKLNLNLWKNQVEANKTLISKTGVKKNKEIDIAKAFPGKVDFKTYNKPDRVSESLQKNNVFNKREDKGQIDLNPTRDQIEAGNVLPDKSDFNSFESQVETIKTLPGTINFSSASSQVEVATTLPGYIEFSATKAGEIRTLPGEIEEPKILPGKIDFEMEYETYESKAEISEPFQDNIYYSTTENSTEGISTLPGEANDEKKVEDLKPIPGKFDLKAWESQVEVNKTLVDKIDVVRSENLDEVAKTFPAKIEFITYESEVEEARTLPATIDFNSPKNKVQITQTSQIKTDLEADEKESNDLKHKDYKVVPDESDPKESLSDPELVDEDPEVEVEPNTDSIIGNIKRKLFFITNKNSVQNSSNIPTETISVVGDNRDNDYETKVEELLTKNYSINDMGKKTSQIKSVSSVSSTTTEETYERKSESIEESYKNTVTDDSKNISAKEYELSDKTNTVHTELTRSVSAYGADDVITSPDFKRTKSLFETSEPNISNTVNENIKSEKEFIFNTAKDQNEITKRAHSADDSITSPEDFKRSTSLVQTPEHKISNKVNENVINENGFNVNTTKVQNELTRSAYGADDLKTATEDLKRAKSLAELDLGDVIHGQVRRMVGRIKSVDFSRRESIKIEINIKELPKKMSVLEKIALFEGKTSPKIESTTLKTAVTKKVTPVISEEEYLKKIEELTNGKTKFGRLEEMLYLPLANGAEMPVLALGTAMVDPRLLTYVIGAAIDMGYRAIDTAYIYGNEKEIGRGIKAKIDDGTVKREDLFIISKLWSTFHRSDLVEVACRASLENLGLDYFDLYLIHNPMSFKEGSDPIPKIATVLQYSQHDYLDAWFGMEGLVTKGLAKSIGVSNFNSQQIQKILDKGRLKPVVNQVECHPYLSQRRLHTYCAERNIVLSCFGVLGSKGTPAEYKNSTTPVIDDALVKVMASGLGVTPAQLLIRYQIDSGHNVVVKASTAAHLWDNLQALTFTLDQPQIDALHALNKNKRTFTFRGMGDTHKNYPFLATY